MKDLKFDYIHNNNRMHVEYDTITDFINQMESNDKTAPDPDDTVIFWILFDNPFNSGGFTTIKDLLAHLKFITS